jgi:hypothetical protein
MEALELRNRLARLGWTNRRAAARLGLSAPGLHHQLDGTRPVSRQTELLLEVLEERRPQALYSFHDDPPPSRSIIQPPAARETPQSAVLTNVDFKEVELQGAVRALDDFGKRYKGLLGAAGDELLSRLRWLLLRRLEANEAVQLDVVRRGRRPALKVVDTDVTGTTVATTAARADR